MKKTKKEKVVITQYDIDKAKEEYNGRIDVLSPQQDEVVISTVSLKARGWLADPFKGSRGTFGYGGGGGGGYKE